MKSRKRIVIVIILTIAISGFATFLISSRDAPSSNHQPEVVTYSTDKPDEKAPAKDYQWKGGDRDPKKIIIPSIGVDNFIQKVGVDQNKQIAVPSNIHLAGWFIDTVQPGEKGLSIIDGHVNGQISDKGVFRNLEKLKENDDFTITLGSGQAIKYKVISMTSVPTEQAAAALFSQDPKVSSQLNLITCGGSWDKKSRNYSHRIIIQAKLANN